MKKMMCMAVLLCVLVFGSTMTASAEWRSSGRIIPVILRCFGIQIQCTPRDRIICFSCASYITYLPKHAL